MLNAMHCVDFLITESVMWRERSKLEDDDHFHVCTCNIRLAAVMTPISNYAASLSIATAHRVVQFCVFHRDVGTQHGCSSY